MVEGDENTVLVPGDRYAQMRNVYFIPSAAALKMWLEKCGFVDVRIVDVCATTTEEQRRTEWMITESLADFLDPDDSGKTLEGYPAPVRAVIIANKPRNPAVAGEKVSRLQIKVKKRPLLKLQGPGTGNHHIGRHDVQQKTV
ncbi:tRNA (mo5U34)-methyltransferase [Raoultella planticola]|uniref:tRNA (Mo5U34)-methyltransferase n=1 Tax=Raoultella planticola TaxID=575 RepID=A0A485AD09_RAOPL|nr:tRNA (mo5U34)-methyltransferase [Raoultella planticola]